VVEMPLRRSTVHSAELLGYEGGIASLDLRVGSGTYVRAIADALGGHCRTLRRTEVGPFRIEDADEERILPPVEALPFLPLVEVDAEAARAIRAGRTRHDEPVRVVQEGELVAVNGTVMPP
jgi:tRNA pseudouridine55 synthase